MPWNRQPREIPKCYACGKNRVNARSFQEYKDKDLHLCSECEQLENPYNKPDECSLCTLFKRPGPVHHRGKPSPLMFVAEAPGDEEVKPYNRKPLVGGSGKVHDRICQIVGISSWDHWNTNIVRCRPENNRKPDEYEIRCCARYIITEIETVKPNVIVALGDTALSTLTGKAGIFKYRGVVMEGFGGRKVIATLHPAYVMRDPGKFRMPIDDYRKAITEARTPTISRVEVVYNLDASPVTDGQALLERARRTGVAVSDIETIGTGGTYNGALDPSIGQVVCIGLSDDTPGRAECYRWSPATAALTTAVYSDPSIEKVGQNSEGFDYVFLHGKGIPEPVGRTFDTMVAEHLINPDSPKDLGTLGNNYTDMPYWKDDAKKNLFLYNCQDIDGTARGYYAQKKELARLDMLELMYDHVMPVQPILRAMQRRGIKKNTELAARWIVALNAKADRMEAALREGLGSPYLNVNSSKEMQDLLYNKLGLPVQYKRTKFGFRPTADAEALDNLAEQFPDMKILQMVHQIRTIRTKLIATYLQSEADEKEFVHPRFGTSKAANGRFNSWDPNAQNVPFELREIYTADDADHVWIESDWGQVEWRIDMIDASDPNGLEVMRKNLEDPKKYDIFRMTKAGFGGGSPEDVTDDERHAMKFVVYGVAYGRQAESISKSLAISEREAQKYIDGYLNVAYPELGKARKERVKFVEQNYYLANPFKRRRWWYTRQITEVYNFYASSTAADMMYDVLRDVEYQLPKGATIRLTVHDALDVVAHRDVAKLAFECVKDNMSRVWPMISDQARNPALVKKYYPNGWWCPADAHIGRNWAEAKKGNKDLEKEILG